MSLKNAPRGKPSIVRRKPSATRPSPVSAEIAAALLPQGNSLAAPAKLPTGTQSTPTRAPKEAPTRAPTEAPDLAIRPTAERVESPAVHATSEAPASREWHKGHLVIAFVTLNALGFGVMRLLGV